MAMYAVRYQGLNKRETYDEILGYLEAGGGAGIDIAYPNRTASFIRNSQQYQNLLTYDFVDLKEQQDNVLKQQKRDIIVKEQSSGSNASMKSIIASGSPSESLATQQLNSDFSSLGDADDIQYEHYASMDDYLRAKDEEEDEKKQRMAERGKAGMVSHIDAVTKLSESFAAAKATGTEPFQGTTGNKLQDKFIKDGQDLDLLRVVEGKNPPKYISELSKDKEAVEMQRQRLGLSPDPQTQAAASSSSGAAQFKISTPRSKSRARSTTGTKGETDNPETNVAKGRGRPVNPDSARQKALAKSAAKNNSNISYYLNK